MIEIQFDNREVLEALQTLQKASSDLSPALLEIGEVLTESTKQRFADTQGPDGKAWSRNKTTTIAHKGRDQPLSGETGSLMDTINYQLEGNDTVVIGSPMEYAAMQQFGGKKSEFPHLWGDIPARAFLGVSDEDEKQILQIINDHLAAAL